MDYEDAVHLHLSCAHLPAECCRGGVRIVIRAALPESHEFVEIGATDVVSENLDPSFERPITIISRFDIDQHLLFELHIMNAENVTPAVAGSVGIGLRAIVNSPSELLLPLEPTSHVPLWELDESPLLSVEARDPQEAKNGTVIQFHAHNLHADRIMPYFCLSLLQNSVKHFPTLLYRSEILFGNSNPMWKAFTVPTKYISMSSHAVLEIAVYNYRYNLTADVLIGKFTITFLQLLNGTTTKFMLHAAGQSKKEHTFVELVRFDRVANIPTFFAAIRSGLKLHFTAAIDFTISSGNINETDSLHFVHPNFKSPYYQALNDIAESVCQYDAQQRLSLLGFGAKVPPKFEFSHLFPLTGDSANPYVRGVSDALSTYRQAAMSVQPFAPVDYSSVIHDVLRLAKVAHMRAANIYFVLIILTNGCLKNARDTIDTLVQASELPISVCFVGVENDAHRFGNGDHTRVTRLLDPTHKSADNRPLLRQAVSFTEYKHTAGKTSVRELLANVPVHVTQWLLHLAQCEAQ